MSIILPHRPSPPKKQTKKKKSQSSKDAVRTGTLLTTNDLLRLQSDSIGVNKLRISAATPTLPPSFFSLFKNLCVLDLRNVGLEVLPPQIIALENLQKLDLRYNNLTYLPSQIAQLPNLHQLQLYDDRDRKTRLLDRADREAQFSNISTKYDCICKDSLENGKVPPIPTLAQLCIRLILSSIPRTAVEGTDEISWQDLEPFYSTGKFQEKPCDINQQLPFPSHFLPVRIPFDICSACSEVVLPAHAQFDKVEVVALCKVRLRYVFCSHTCFSRTVQEWECELLEEIARMQLRQSRFHLKDRNGEDR